jgi:predicted ATPase
MAARSSSPLTEFIGREEELALLRAHLDQACAGTGGIALLAGEPGIGKTRTAEELAVDAQLRGAQVLWGRCYEEEGAPAYWPWVQLIRAYARACEPTALRAELGPGAAEVAHLVPELREWLPGLPNPPSLQPVQARFHLFDSVTTFLQAAAERQTMLILDDLHWADRPCCSCSSSDPRPGRPVCWCRRLSRCR